MINGKNVFDQPKKIVKQHVKIFKKIATCQANGYITGCLLDSAYSGDNYKMIAIDLGKQKGSDARENITRILFILEEAN